MTSQDDTGKRRPDVSLGRPHEAFGNDRPRQMVASAVASKPQLGQNPAYSPSLIRTFTDSGFFITPWPRKVFHMPLRSPDPFKDRLERLNPEVNPYVTQLVEAQKTGTLPVAAGPMLRALQGAWRERFQESDVAGAKPARLICEIGCHKGHTLLTMAADHPETAFIGIDITIKRVVTTAERAKERGLTNIITVLANAVAIDQLFAPGELDGVVIFFPDPWVKKKRQAKNRLINDEFCRKLYNALRPGALVWFKSDQKLYFDIADEALVQAGFLPAETTLAPSPFDRDYTSSFERRFHEDGLPTHGSKWLKPV